MMRRFLKRKQAKIFRVLKVRKISPKVREFRYYGYTRISKISLADLDLKNEDGPMNRPIDGNRCVYIFGYFMISQETQQLRAASK